MVTVGRDKNMVKDQHPPEEPEPKRRGRKRQAKPDEVFTGDLVGGGVSVPAVEGGGDQPDTLFPANNSGAGSIPNEAPPPAKPDWPTRSTFAGRKNTGPVWEERRAAFYTKIPSSHWKDALERTFWNLCSESTVDDAVQNFLAQEVPSDAQPSGKSKKAPKAKAKAKAKSSIKKPLLKEPGRGRGKGRGRCGRGKAACRE